MTEASKAAERYMTRSKAESLKTWINGFLRDCRVRELSPYTLKYYSAQLAHFEAYASAQGVTEAGEITAALLRDYLLELEAQGHNPGGRRTKYIAVRAFLNWWQEETEARTNPAAKVKPPKITRDVIDGAKIEDIRAMLATCDGGFLGLRDRAVILCLLDTGARAGEFLSLDFDDIDLIGGAVILRKSHTKNKKQRTVFIGRKSRRALRAYLKIRADDNAALWVTRAGERLAMPSFQGLLKRRGRLAKLRDIPSAHDYRRAHALMMLRAGTDVITLARLMGHSTLEVLTRYLKQSADDLHAAHDRAGVDKWL